MLRMQRISKSFGSVHANRSIDLEVAPGRIVLLARMAPARPHS